MSDRKTGVTIRSIEVTHRGWQTMTRYTADIPGQAGSLRTIVREIADHGNSVAVLPIDPQRRTVLLTRQFRLAAHLNGHHGWLIEACAGMIDDGETAEDAVLREASEELGFDLHDLRVVAGVFLSPGASQEHATLFSARYSPGDRLSHGGGADESEDIEVIEMALADAVRGVSDGSIMDAKTVILIQAALLSGEA